MEKEHLLGKTLEELQAVAEENGLPRFAAKQIASWLYEKRIDHIAGMSNLSLKHRELLSQRYDIGREAPVQSLPVSYTHLRAHETGRNLVCRLLLEKKKEP